MTKAITILTLALGLATAVPAAQAATAPVLPAPASVLQVSGGCGPGGHRDGYGYCRPNFRRPPPPAYRGCPPGWHPSPYGCRRNY